MHALDSEWCRNNSTEASAPIFLDFAALRLASAFPAESICDQQRFCSKSRACAITLPWNCRRLVFTMGPSGADLELQWGQRAGSW